MYQTGIVLSIKQIETNVTLSIPSLRTNSPGITFTNTQTPTLLIELSYTLVSRLISIDVPNQNGKTNVNQIEATFYGIDGQILRNSAGEKWIVETTVGVTKLETLVPNVPVSAFELRLLSTTDNNVPRNVTVEIIACSQPSSSTVSSGSPTSTTTFSTSMTTRTSACVLSQWGPWSTCTPECEPDRYQQRVRSVLSGSCSDPLSETRPCDQTPCEQCKITRENYIRELGQSPPSSGFVGYYINSTSTTQTDQPVSIDDIIDRDSSIFVDNCTRLMCTPDGLTKVKIPCQNDCEYSPWSEWSACYAPCGQSGVRTRKQYLINYDPSNPNPLCARENIETAPCTGDPCPCIEGVNCTCDLTTWSNWTQCSKSCGNGQRMRSRQYKTNSTETCPPENLQETQSCNVDCCPVDGKLSPWSTWSSCSKTCGSGVRQRYRSCNDPEPSCKGKPCEGSTVDTDVCNTNLCETDCPTGQIPSDCANECDTSCGSLTCDNQCRTPDKCMPGCVCSGSLVMGPDGQCIEPKDCTCRLPSSNITLVNGESYTQDPRVTYTCKDGCLIPNNTNYTECQWSMWTPFSSCSDTCNGTQSRFRTHTGPNCTDIFTEEDKQPCSSNCTVVCYETTIDGTVIKYNVGDLVSETRCNRTVCRETGSLETQPNPGTRVDGQWNLWSDWNDCSRTCNGTRTRYRLCSSPPPDCGGDVCKLLDHTNVDIVTIGNNSQIVKETESEKCNQLCFSSTTAASTITTMPHEECYVFNGTDTIVVQPGEVVENPANSCEICVCNDGSLLCSTICSENEQTCLSKQAQDHNNLYTWIPALPGQCCGTCNKTQVQSQCRVELLPDEYIKVEGCQSLMRVGRERCAGGCESQASNSLTMANAVYQLGNPTCKCCAPKDVYVEEISMNCTAVDTSGGYLTTARYTHIRSCDCQVCKG